MQCYSRNAHLAKLQQFHLFLPFFYFSSLSPSPPISYLFLLSLSAFLSFLLHRTPRPRPAPLPLPLPHRADHLVGRRIWPPGPLMAGWPPPPSAGRRIWPAPPLACWPPPPASGRCRPPSRASRRARLWLPPLASGSGRLMAGERRRRVPGSFWREGLSRAWIGEASASPICRGEELTDRGRRFFGGSIGELLETRFCVFSPKNVIGEVIGSCWTCS